MSDIQAGDVVVCVDTSDADSPDTLRRQALARLEAGRSYRVTWIGIWSALGREVLALRLDGVRNADIQPAWQDLWKARRFRKIRPDEHEPCEEEFTELVRKMRPVPAVKAPTDA